MFEKEVKKYSNLRSQKAVFIPLTAVIALGLFTFLYLLVGYTGRVKVAQSELRLKLDIACGDVSKQQGYRHQLNAFGVHVMELMADDLLSYSTIDKAILIMPTMPDDRTLGGSSFEFPKEGDPGPVTVGGTEEATVSACPKCKVYRSFKHAAVSNNFPPDFLNDLRSAGNTVSCILKARVKTDLFSPYIMGLLGGDDTTLTLKSVWWSPVRGPSPVYDDSGLPSSNDKAIETSPGLTIAIGTELFTSSWDRRFRFKYGSTAQAYNPIMIAYPLPAAEPASADIFEGYQPEVRHNGGGAPATIPQLDAPADRHWARTAYNIPQLARSPAYENLAANFSPLYYLPPVPPAGIDPSMPSDREALITACMNPLILMRNTFLSTVVELSSRHGQLRNMTEILHMNPMHRHRDLYPAGSYISNFPVKLVPFGNDLTDSLFQLPYVFYNTGADGNEFPDINSSAYEWFSSNTNGFDFERTNRFGWINPFTPGPGAPAWQPNPNFATKPEVVKEHALIAGQLRYCHSLYEANGIERNSDFMEFLKYDANYDPTIYGTHKASANSTDWATIRQRPAFSASAPQRWDQKCHNGTSADCGNGNIQRAEALTAGELVSILGSTQICPYSSNNPEVNAANAPLQDIIRARTGTNLPVYPCPLTVPPINMGYNLDFLSAPWANPSLSLQSLELAPDILGTLRYIVKTDDQSLAINSPGLFPLRTLDNSEPAPFESNKYTLAQNISSSILFVTHQPPPDDQAIKDQIMSVLGGMYSNPDVNFNVIRPITLIYMPSNYADHQKENFDSVFAGAELGSLSNDTDALVDDDDTIYYDSDKKGYRSPIVIYNFSPYNEYWGPLCDGPGVITDERRTAGEDIDDYGNWKKENGDIKSQAEVFQDYWNCMLTDPNRGIVAQAKRIFKIRILKNELKF